MPVQRFCNVDGPRPAGGDPEDGRRNRDRTDRSVRGPAAQAVDLKEAYSMADDDRDTVVVRDSGSGAGMILGILAVIIVLAGLWYFAMGPGSGGGTTTQENNPDVNIEVPVEPVEPAPS
jgi:hypothetical protein